MTIAVRYFTRSGNTQKLASAIAKAVGVCEADLSAPLSEKTDVLFLGASYYAFDMDPAVKAFLKDNKDKIGRVVCFGTSAMMKSMKKPMKKVLDEAGVAMDDAEFHCRGEFKFAHKGRPNADDLAQAAAFAKSIVSK